MQTGLFCRILAEQACLFHAAAVPDKSEVFMEMQWLARLFVGSPKSTRN
ncbi:MAG: hypothetical protein K0Q90_3483 [Paenibacillaceae bacterium]|jgi:hypothetical protein|nr:hypothetical protein [Paenibacillaceae bacterium]